jgi:hypothetical protein
MKVIIKRVPGAEFAASRLVIRGGVRNWGEADAGIEQLAISVATRGGAGALDKDAYARKLAKLGGSVFGASDDDYAMMGASGPREAWDDVLAFWDVVDDEDRDVCEAQQRGVASAGFLPSRFTPRDEGVHQFEARVAQALLS